MGRKKKENKKVIVNIDSVYIRVPARGFLAHGGEANSATPSTAMSQRQAICQGRGLLPVQGQFVVEGIEAKAREGAFYVILVHCLPKKHHY